MTDHRDDLPGRTDEHVGETDSRRRFDGLMTDPYFLVRAEQGNDYGVDVTVEALSRGGSPTNFRAQVQLKASHKDANSDGSYSYPVARTNLNYLMNSPGSIYVLLARDEDKVLYKSVDEVYAEREAESSTWHEQATLTIRFEQELDIHAVGRLRDDVVRINTHLRNLRLKLATQAISLQSTIQYDPETEEVRDLSATRARLSREGLAMVAAGYVALAQKLLSEVPQADWDAELWLVDAYAAYTRGQVLSAVNAANRSLMADKLDNDKAALALYLVATTKNAMGLSDALATQQAMAELERRYPTSVSALYARMERLRRESVGGSEVVVEQLEILVDQIKARGPSFGPLELQARTIFLEANYFLLNQQYVQAVIDYRIQAALGLDTQMLPERARVAKQLVKQLHSILTGFEDLHASAKKMGHRGVEGEVIYALETCLLQDRMSLEKTAPPDPSMSEKLVESCKRSIVRLDQAVAAFNDAGAAEGALRSRLLQVDLLWMMGDRARAAALANEIVEVSASRGFGAVAKLAAAVAAGNSPLQKWERIPNLYDLDARE